MSDSRVANYWQPLAFVGSLSLLGVGGLIVSINHHELLGLIISTLSLVPGLLLMIGLLAAKKYNKKIKEEIE